MHMFLVSNIHNSHFLQDKHLGDAYKELMAPWIFTSTTWSITCVQPFKNKALRPPQPLTSA
jgi:hypothetical protein